MSSPIGGRNPSSYSPPLQDDSPQEQIHSRHGGAAVAGSNKTLSAPQGENAIPDNLEPITFIQNKIQDITGKKIEDCAGLNIKSHFVKAENSQAIKAMAYRTNLKSPSCYYFERVFVVDVSDKNGNPLPPLVFKKNIYTNIVIPTNNDAGLLNDRETMAGIVANTYATFIQNAILFRTGQPTSFAKLTDDQITKVQRDNFLIMGLYSKKQQIKPNQLKKALGKTITQVDLQFRAGRKESRDEESRNSSFMISLSQKVNDTSIKTIGQKQRAKKYLLITDNETAPEVKEIAKVQRFRNFEETLINSKNTQDLIEALEANDISKDAIIQHYHSENEALENKFADLWDLFNRSPRVDVARNLYGPGMNTVSSDLKAKLPSSKQKTPEFGVLRALVLAHSEATGRDKIKEAGDLVECYRAAHKDLRKIHEQMKRNAEFIKRLGAADSDETKAMDDRRKERRRVIEEIADILPASIHMKEDDSERFEEDDVSEGSFYTDKYDSRHATRHESKRDLPPDLPWIKINPALEETLNASETETGSAVKETAVKNKKRKNHKANKANKPDKSDQTEQVDSKKNSNTRKVSTEGKTFSRFEEF